MGRGGGRLLEVGSCLKNTFGGGVVGMAGRLLTFSTFRVGAYSRCALNRVWRLNE